MVFGKEETNRNNNPTVSTGITTTIDLLRHGQPVNDQCLSGHTDAPLTEKGWHQMRRTLSGVNGYDRVISSPLVRCADFAEEYATQQKLPFQTLKPWQEMGFGQWCGLSYQELHERFPEQLLQFWSDPWTFSPPDGEPIGDFIARILQAWSELLHSYSGQHLLLVTHSGIIRQLIGHILEMDARKSLVMSHIEINHGSLTRIQVYQDENSQLWPRLMFQNLRTPPLVE